MSGRLQYVAEGRKMKPLSVSVKVDDQWQDMTGWTCHGLIADKDKTPKTSPRLMEDTLIEDGVAWLDVHMSDEEAAALVHDPSDGELSTHYFGLKMVNDSLNIEEEREIKLMVRKSIFG